MRGKDPSLQETCGSDTMWKVRRLIDTLKRRLERRRETPWHIKCPCKRNLSDTWHFNKSDEIMIESNNLSNSTNFVLSLCTSLMNQRSHVRAQLALVMSEKRLQKKLLGSRFKIIRSRWRYKYVFDSWESPPSIFSKMPRISMKRLIPTITLFRRLVPRYIFPRAANNHKS
jgi:hypothetical protein